MAEFVRDRSRPYISSGTSGEARSGSIKRFDVETHIPNEILVPCDMGCVAVAFLFLIIRLHLRIRRKLFNMEDWFIIAAWIVFALAMSFESAGSIIDSEAYEKIKTIREIENGGPTQGELYIYEPFSREEEPHFLRIQLGTKLNYFMIILYHTPLYLVKFAWLKFYDTLIPKILVKTRDFWACTVMFTLAGYICTVIFVTTACDPEKILNPPLYWYHPPVETQEASMYRSMYANPNCSPFIRPEVVYVVFGFHAISELCVYVLPLFVIFRLRNITVGKRISVSILFLLGFLCLFLMVWNVWFCSSLLPREDFSYNSLIAGLFWPLEPAWAIIITCLPAFRTRMNQAYNKIIAHTSQGRGRKYGSASNPPSELDGGYCREPSRSRNALDRELDDVESAGKKESEMNWD